MGQAAAPGSGQGGVGLLGGVGHAGIFGTRTGQLLADQILTLLKSKAAMTETDIHESFHGAKSGVLIQSALELLETNGLAAVREEKTGGRPRRTWRAQ